MAVMPDGYGRCAYRGKRHLAHRLAYELAHGNPPGAALVLHSCDNPPCCNPAHLRPGTDAENCADRKVRRRHWRDRRPETAERYRGEASSTTVLSNEIVRAVVLLSAGGASRRSISEQLSVRMHNVANVLAGVCWNHVTGLPKRKGGAMQRLADRDAIEAST